MSYRQEERELAEKKQGQYNTMEKRGSDLQKEVKILQEALADYNTVLDKVSITDKWRYCLANLI
jgi:intraflagellar transport protein 74